MHRLSGVERNARMFAWLLAAAALIGSIAFMLLTAGTQPARAAHAGTRILFDRRVAEPSDYDILTMRTNGSHQRALTHNPADDYGPFPSPNGRKIVFNSDRDGNHEIFIMRADGSHQRQLTHTPSLVNNALPSFSPNGKRIAFASDRDGNSEIFTMRANGSHVHQLTHTTPPS